MKCWIASVAVAAAAAMAVPAAAFAADPAPAAQPAAAASPTPTAEPAPVAPPAPEAAPAPAPEPTPAPAPAATEEPKAKIIFYRPSRLTGAVYTYRIVQVDEDGKVAAEDKRLGRLPNGTYFVAELPAGIYNFNITGPMAVNLAKDRLRIEVEPGETYYVEQTVRMGLVTGGFRLVPSTKADFDKRTLKEADQSKMKDDAAAPPATAAQGQ